MQNFSNDTLESKAGSSGSASVLFVMSILGLACAAFTVAMPGAGDQLLSDACSALSCDASQENVFHFSRAIEPAGTETAVLPAKAAHAASAPALPAEVAISAADQQWQVAQAFNAMPAAAPQQTASTAGADNSTTDRFTPLAYLADAVPAMH